MRLKHAAMSKTAIEINFTAFKHDPIQKRDSILDALWLTLATAMHAQLALHRFIYS